MTTSPRRLLPLRPDQLDADQLVLRGQIVGGPRSSGPQAFPIVDDEGRLDGPFDAMLRRPKLGAALQGLGVAVRYETTFTPRAREIAILTVAAHWQSAFETYAHEAIGRRAGLTDDELDALRGGTAHFDDPVEQAVADAARAAVVRGDLTDEEYAAGLATLGEGGLFEVLTLVGYYGLLALQLRVFRIGRPEETGG